MTEPYILLYTDTYHFMINNLRCSYPYSHALYPLANKRRFAKENVCAYIQMVEKKMFSVFQIIKPFGKCITKMYTKGRVYKCKSLRLNNVDMLLNLWSSTRLIRYHIFNLDNFQYLSYKKRRLLLGRKVMTNLDSIFKSRDITLPAKVHLVKAMVFPVVMYGCESWIVKKAECQRIDVFELWCWRRLLRVPWIARRSNQSILKEISPGISLEGMMLKLKLQYFGHLMRRVDSLEKTDAGRDWGQEEKGTTEDEMAGWHHRLDGRESE